MADGWIFPRENSFTQQGIYAGYHKNPVMKFPLLVVCVACAREDDLVELLNSQPWTNSYKGSLEGEITIFVICASNLWSSTVLVPGQSSLISSNVLISS